MTFTATLQNIKRVIGMIKAIQFRPMATCNIHEEGLSFTVTESQSIKAVVYAKRAMFERYRPGSENIAQFDIHLGTFVDCLGILCPAGSSQNECQIQYEGTGSPLILTRNDNENRLTNTCKIQTLEAEFDMSNLSLNDSDIEQSVIMKASWLQDALGDLDHSCEKVSFVFSEQNPCFQLFGSGTNGSSSTTEYHEEDTEPFISFERLGAGTYKYLYSHISRCTKALDQASDVSLRISREGVLSLLFKVGGIPAVYDDAAYVDFTIVPCAD